MTGLPTETRTAQVRVGCSGWLYRHRFGRFYPTDLPARQGFTEYANQFNTVELSSTFPPLPVRGLPAHRLPAPAAMERWADVAPPGFAYSVKLDVAGGHRQKLRNAENWLPQHIERIRLLGESRGPTIIQIPPRWRRDTGRLADFLALATSDPDLRWAVELGDPSWVDDSVFNVLADHDTALVLHDLIADLPFTRTTDWTYLRFRGPGGRRRPYRSRYGGQLLAAVADRVGPWIAEGNDVYAYFNHEGDGHARADARTLRQLLVGWA